MTNIVYSDFLLIDIQCLICISHFTIVAHLFAAEFTFDIVFLVGHEFQNNFLLLMNCRVGICIQVIQCSNTMMNCFELGVLVNINLINGSIPNIFNESIVSFSAILHSHSNAHISGYLEFILSYLPDSLGITLQ